MAEQHFSRLNSTGNIRWLLILSGLVMLLALGCGGKKLASEPGADAAPEALKAVETPPAKPAAKVAAAASPDQLYQQAFAAYKKRDFDKSIALFEQLVNTYPNYRLVDNSLYWTAECLYSRRDYEGAIAIFKSVADKYPDGNKAPDALLKIGYSYIALKDYVNAVYYLKKIVIDYSFSPISEKAQDMLERFKVEGRETPE